MAFVEKSALVSFETTSIHVDVHVLRRFSFTFWTFAECMWIRSVEVLLAPPVCCIKNHLQDLLRPLISELLLTAKQKSRIHLRSHMSPSLDRFTFPKEPK